jgi:GH24 family phage-related lysozyme (muramidase)
MQNLIEMLKRHEGEVVTNGRHLIYKCPAGHWTIGIGRNVDVNGGLGLSDAEVDFLLEGELASMIETGEYSE